MVKELRNQLKGQTLSDVLPDAFKQVGGSVYPDEPSAVDLANFRDIVQSYQSVHLPSYGRVIPNQTSTTNVTMSSTKTSVVLIEVPANQTLRILGIACKQRSDYETGGAVLSINDINVLSLTNFDTLSAAFGAVITDINDDLIITGGAILRLHTSANPNDDVIIEIVYDIHQQ